MAMIEAIDGVKSLDELLKLDAKLVTDYGTTGFFELNAGWRKSGCDRVIRIVKHCFN